ncbi:GNAT family N-acetyltransferase [Candidatus Laterigemmans baculatus]|uniref:GNAT family N-acetyltransferase n=1 Tax=Candidatus Laterigemmans baculatus TaxID=2770505 RepID=UPI0013D9C489|nr:GNAT family N-acetyltransferase [Candidatus Laterigemmans baculatus]
MKSRSEAAVSIVEADLSLATHQREVLALTEAYAREPMGNGGPLSPEVLERLIPGLRAHPTTLILLAYRREQGDEEQRASGGEEHAGAVGIATCFVNFSTFLGRPLLNIHDLAVLPDFQGRGIGRALLEAAEAKAQERGCGRITLEVLENNLRAKRIYEAAGFRGGSAEAKDRTLFYTKPLAP